MRTPTDTSSRKAARLGMAWLFGVFATLHCPNSIAAPTEPSETLADDLAQAYAANPGLQSQRAAARAIDEGSVQARAGLRPTVDASASVVRSSSQAPYFLPSSATLANSSQEQLQITQPIYAGGRLARAEDAADADAHAAHEGLRTAELQLIQSVIQAYLDVRRDEEQLKTMRAASEALKDQLDEANARFLVGEVTKTDVAQAQARLAQAAAQAAQSEGALTTSRADFAALVGHAPATLAPEPPISQLLPPSLDAALAIAERQNPQVRQAAFAAQASAARVGEAQSAFRPTVSLSASFGYVGGAQVAPLPTNNPFANSQPNVTVAVTASVPIYAGGLRFSQVREAAERNNADRYSADNTRLQVIKSVSEAWSKLIVAKSSLAAYQSEVDADAAAFVGARKEEQAGLRTTIDVLNAEQELQTAEIALSNAHHDEYLASAMVLAAVGTLNIKDFSPTTAIYDPNANLKKRMRSAGGVPWEGTVDAIDRVGAGKAPADGPTPSDDGARPR